MLYIFPFTDEGNVFKLTSAQREKKVELYKDS